MAANSNTHVAERQLTEAERATLREQVKARSERILCAELGVSRQTFARAVAGFELHTGNVVLFRQYLAGAR